MHQIHYPPHQILCLLNLHLLLYCPLILLLLFHCYLLIQPDLLNCTRSLLRLPQHMLLMSQLYHQTLHFLQLHP